MNDPMRGTYKPPKKHKNRQMSRTAFIQTEVDNPYSVPPSSPQISKQDAGFKGGKERVYRRISDNPLLTMLARKRIDDAQFLAGQKYQNAHLILTGQMGQGMDYSRQRVDCSQMPTSLAERQLQASDVIRHANGHLKLYGMNEKDDMEAVLRVQKIAGEGLSVTQYCQIIRGLKSSKSVSKQMEFLRHDLSALAQYWRLSS